MDRSLKRWGRRSKVPPTGRLILLQDFEEWVVIRNAVGIEVGSIRQTLEFSPLATWSGCPWSGESGTYVSLLLFREAFNQFDDVQRRGTHNHSVGQKSQSDKSFFPPQQYAPKGSSRLTPREQ